MRSASERTRLPTFGSPKPRKRWLDLAPFAYPTDEVIYLERPKKLPTHNFTKVLFARRSRRRFGPLAEHRLGALLWLTVKTREVSIRNGRVTWQYRPAPAAGAVHAVDLLVMRRVRRMWKAFLYDPSAHALKVLSVERRQINAVLNSVQTNLPIGRATVLWMVGDVNRLRARYENEGSLLWRDAGVLLATLCLAAEALGLAACPVGELAVKSVPRMLGSQVQLLSLGGLLIGERVEYGPTGNHGAGSGTITRDL